MTVCARLLTETLLILLSGSFRPGAATRPAPRKPPGQGCREWPARARTNMMRW